MGKKTKKQSEGKIKLIDIVYKDLKKHGNYETISKGSFDDGSGSWIELYHSLSPDRVGKRYCQVISFNGAGTEMDDINIFEEKMSWEDDQKKID